MAGCEQEVTGDGKSSAVTKSGKILKVGVIGSLSGSDEALGANGLLGVQAALALQPYLQNGDKIELVVKDDLGEPAVAVKLLNELADEQVTAILALSRSEVVLELAPLVDTFKIPVVATIATHPFITRNSFLTQLSFDDTFQGKVAALYARDELLIDRVAVFSEPDSPHSSFLVDEFINTFEAVGGIIFDHILLGEAGMDYQTLIEGMLYKDIEMVYLPVKATKVIELGEAANALGWYPTAMASDGLLSTILLNHSDKLHLLNGLLATDIFTSCLPLTAYGERVSSSFLNLSNEVGTSFAIMGAEGLALLLLAMERCDDPVGSSCVNTNLQSTKNFQGMQVEFSVGSDGKVERPVFVNAIKGDQMIFKVKVH